MRNFAPVIAVLCSQILVFGRRIPLNELEVRIDSITVAQLRDVCRRHIFDRAPVFIAVGQLRPRGLVVRECRVVEGSRPDHLSIFAGQTKGLEDYATLRARMRW